MLQKVVSILMIVAMFSLTACNNADQGNQEGAQKTEQGSSPEEKDGGMASIKDDESQKNVLQVAASSDAHTTLAKAVKAAGLANTLANPGPFTVFAPTNAAFGKLPKETLNSLMKPENKQKLRDILERHAAPVSYDKEALGKMADKGETLFMANGDYLEIKKQNGEVTIKGAKIVQSVKASNGMVHVVDKVILPED